MPESSQILLDQNVPVVISDWLSMRYPAWKCIHANAVGLANKPDEKIFEWAQDNRSLIVTFDEDFADHRSFVVKRHCGIVRLRVWPTTIEETQAALQRLFDQFSPADISGSLVIIDRGRIRVRKIFA